jgi:hypothetical protein
MDATATLRDVTSATANGDGLIDVRKLMAELSVEQLCRTADEYVRLDSWDFHPQALRPDRRPQCLPLSLIFRGLKLLPGMSVIDWGRYGLALCHLTQMGWK